MTTAQQLLESAYARSTANDAGKLATDAELLGRLNRVFQGIYALAARARPDEYAGAFQFTWNGSPATVALPADLIEIRGLFTLAGAVVHLIPAREVTRSWHIAPSVYRLGGLLYSRAAAGDPVAGQTLIARLLDAPAALAALATLVDARFPTRHHELLANDLALYLATKDEGRDPAHFSQVSGDQTQRLVAFAAEYALDAAALEWIHQPAEHVPVGGPPA